MSRDKVELYFPDAPEQCLECPALGAAADNIDMYYGIASAGAIAAAEEGRLERPATGSEIAAEVVAEFIGVGQIERTQKASDPIAAELYGHCSQGPYKSVKTREAVVRGTILGGLFSKAVSTEVTTYFIKCNSKSPITPFTETLSFDSVPHSKKR